MRVAVVGHVEWCEFAPVERLPGPGEIVSSPGSFELAAGGGAVTAVQIAKLDGRLLVLYRARRRRAGPARSGAARGSRRHPRRRLARRAAAQGLHPSRSQRGAQRSRRSGDSAGATCGRWAPVGSPRGSRRRLRRPPGTEDAIRTARQAGALVATTRVGDPLFRSGVQSTPWCSARATQGRRGRPRNSSRSLEP